MQSFNREAERGTVSISFIPDAVQNIPIRVDPDVEVGGENIMEGTDLFIPEECVRHPHLTGVSQS